MAYDGELAERVRIVLDDEPGVVEKRMFGGISFLIGGHIAVAAQRRGWLMARVDPSETPTLLERVGVARMVMAGREMDGWLRVTSPALDEDDDLREWVMRGVDIVHDLPPKER